jgi:hypothetical protein
MPPHPRANTNFDLSFELTTTNIPGTNQFSVSFVRMERLTSPDAARLWTTGYCGCGQQVLQTSRDLIQGAAGWTDVQTKPVPRPVNVWKLVPPGPTNYYRVRMK